MMPSEPLQRAIRILISDGTFPCHSNVRNYIFSRFSFISNQMIACSIWNKRALVILFIFFFKFTPLAVNLFLVFEMFKNAEVEHGLQMK